MVRWTEVFFTLRDSSTRGNKFKLVKQFSRVNCCVLGRVALVAQRPVVVKLSRGRSVGLSVRRYVRRSVCPVHYGKTADRIRMRLVHTMTII